MSHPGGQLPRVWSPMPTGSGAILVHQELASRIDGYTVHSFSPLREMFPPSLYGLRNPSADIVHATPDHAALLANSRQKLVITFHNFVLDEEVRQHSSFVQRLHYRTDLRWLTRAAIARADAITAVSSFVARKVETFFDRDIPIEVIPNGVDTTRFSPGSFRRPGEMVKVLVSGNPSRRKGTQWLEAVADALPSNVVINCTFDQKDLDSFGIRSDKVQAIGKSGPDDMPSLYAAHDILFMPTVREGFGLAVAEAMSCGLPIVASDNSTMPELVVEGKGGYLCETGNVDAYASAILKLAVNQEKREAMGMFNRSRAVEWFSLEQMVSGYRALFASLSR